VVSWSNMVLSLKHWKFARRASWPKELFIGARSDLSVLRKGEQDRLMFARTDSAYTEAFVPTDQDRNATDWERYVR
jgi:hypothetical protein